MNCTTIKLGLECRFMGNTGCNYKSGVCYEINEQCKGCARASELPSGWYCAACPEPILKWKNGNCNLATHMSLDKIDSKIKVNPIKASKRGLR